MLASSRLSIRHGLGPIFDKFEDALIDVVATQLEQKLEVALGIVRSSFASSLADAAASAVPSPEIFPAPPVTESIDIADESITSPTIVAETPRENIPGPGPGKARCSKCGVAGHNARSCGRAPKGNPHSPKSSTEPATIAASSPAAVLPAPAPSPSSIASPPPISSGLRSPRSAVATPPPRSQQRRFESPHAPPPGWTVEGDRREEFTALSELTLNRKC